MHRHLTGEATEAAAQLLGWRLSHTTGAGTVTVQLTETEAYAGEADPASHAWRGPTRRTAAMFGRAGLLYVYRAYGAHWACNVVTGSEGTASAVLLRAGTVVEGLELATERRGPVLQHKLARGPGNLTKALGLTGEHYGLDLLSPDSPVRLEPADRDELAQIETGPRVGVSRAADRPWRYWLAGEQSVSAYRRSPRAAHTEQGA